MGLTLGILFVTTIIGFFIYTLIKSKKPDQINKPSPTTTPTPPIITVIPEPEYGVFDVIIDSEGFFAPCFNNTPKTTIYSNKKTFCENDQFNSPGGEFSNYPSGTLLYIAYEGYHMTIKTDGTNYAVRQSLCSECV